MSTTPETWTAAIAEREMKPWEDGLTALHDTIEVRHGDELVGRAGVWSEPQDPAPYDQAIAHLTDGMPVQWTDRYGIETPADAAARVAIEAHEEAEVYYATERTLTERIEAMRARMDARPQQVDTYEPERELGGHEIGRFDG